MRVVLVDDSAIVRTRLAVLLSTLEGVDVVGQAPDAATGKVLVRQLRPDVLVLDIGLPDESGIDLLRTVRPENASLVIMMFTLHSNPQTRRACAKAGADCFFDKAEELEGLVEALRKVANAFKQRRGRPSGEAGTSTGDVCT